MSATRPALLLLALAAVAACGRGGGPAGRGELAGIEDLRGRVIGVASAENVSTLEARFVLLAGYGLNASAGDGDVTLVEAPAESLEELLTDGAVDATVPPDRIAYQLLQGRIGVYPLSHIAKEMREQTGDPVLASALVTYPDVAAGDARSLEELKALLAESLTYFRANPETVIDAVATTTADRAYLRWWWDRHDIAFGDASPSVQAQLLDLWEAGKAVGDIDSYPELADVLFNRDGQGGGDADGRATVTLGVLDDLSRRCALYAIEEGIVTSDAIDVNITYLASSALEDAAVAKFFDVIEATPLLVPLGAGSDLPLLVLSGGLQDLDGTLLFVRSAPAGD